MEGRFPKGGLYVSFLNCSDSAAEDEMNAWYNQVHIPDVTRGGIFHNATRYVNPQAIGTPEDPRYLTIYETDWEDLAQASVESHRQMGQWRPWSPESRLHPAVDVSKKMLFRRFGRNPIAFAGSTPRGLILKLSDCADPEREAEFNWWYDYRRCFDVVFTSAASSASRYRNVAEDRTEPRYLAIYETEASGNEALRHIRSTMDRSKRLDILVTRYVAAFDLIYSESTAWAKSSV